MSTHGHQHMHAAADTQVPCLYASKHTLTHIREHACTYAGVQACTNAYMIGADCGSSAKLLAMGLSSLQVRVSWLKPSKCSSIEHRLCAAAANDRISNRRRTVGGSFISLNRYTTLKIAGAAHKLSTSRYSEHTFWKLPGAGHKMTIQLVTLTKVCDPFCA